MKHFKKIIIWSLIISGCFFLTISVFLQLKGKDIIINRIKQQYGYNVKIGYLFFSFPSGMTAINVDVKGLGEARDIMAQLDIPSLFAGKFKFRRINVKDGIFISKQGWLPYNMKIKLYNINLYFEDVSFPFEQGKTKFMFVSRIDDKGSLFYDAVIEGKGWIDVVEKDMSAQVRASYPDKPSSASISLVSKNDSMDVNGDINIKELSSLGAEKLMKNKTLTGLFYDAASVLDADVNIKFNFTTKMSDLKIENNKIFISGSITK